MRWSEGAMAAQGFGCEAMGVVPDGGSYAAHASSAKGEAGEVGATADSSRFKRQALSCPSFPSQVSAVVY